MLKTSKLLLFLLPAPVNVYAEDNQECFCLENFSEIRFEWDCREAEDEDQIALCAVLKANACVDPGAEPRRIALNDDWTKISSNNSECGSSCRPQIFDGDGAVIRGEDEQRTRCDE